MHQASVGFHCPECTKVGKQQVYQGIGSLRTAPVLTQVLIGINVAVFLLGVALDGGDAVAGQSGRLQFDFGLLAKGWRQVGPGQYDVLGVGAGEWYRLVTSGFLHYGLIHLALNMYALWMLGNAVEHLAGRLRFGLIYGTSLVAGSLGALVLSPGDLTAGASGAIYGLMGAIFVAQRAQGIPFRNSPLLGVLILNLAFTLGFPGISIGGHLGGLLGGAAAAWILFDYGQRPGVDKRLPYAACGAFALLCVVGSIAFAHGWMPS
ncbi:MAG: rhomboid family protein [Acidimicrobiales bacterium]|nr:rhomboid family protein [Acidimicrobiales bacterium]